jgi:hypothetical protein
MLDRRSEVDRLVEAVVANIDAARAVERPFFHLQFDRVFPDDVYADMMAAMPGEADYRPLPGRTNVNRRRDGTFTRVKVDLFPELVRHFPMEQRAVWLAVGRVLRSPEVRSAFVKRLAPSLAKRFGAEYEAVGMYPIPVLTRDTSGYAITPHTDTHWKGITVQLYLPRDRSATHVGTVFHRELPDGKLERATRMTFAPNSGYAFAVGEDTWHSADPVGPEVRSRDSILLTYFVDSGLLRVLRNRGKRIGNFLLDEAKHLIKR